MCTSEGINIVFAQIDAAPRLVAALKLTHLMKSEAK